MDVSIDLLALFFLAAACAGFVDTIAGGGGLITIPALVLAGTPPLAALATNKLQGCVGAATATLMLLKGKRVVWADLRGLMLFAFIGSAIGTAVVQWLDTSALELLIPGVLVVIAGYFIAVPYRPVPLASISAPLYQRLVIPLIGCYDGMLGPGTGSFYALAGVSLRGLELIKATATAKPLNFASNLASLMIFIVADQVIWILGLVMMAGQIFGAWLGSRYLFKINPAHLRLIIVAVCLLMLSRYIYQLAF